MRSYFSLPRRIRALVPIAGVLSLGACAILVDVLVNVLASGKWGPEASATVFILAATLGGLIDLAKRRLEKDSRDTRKMIDFASWWSAKKDSLCSQSIAVPIGAIPSQFVGRTEAFRFVKRHRDQSQGICVIVGPAGIGKTAVALKVAQERLGEGSGPVWWISGHDAESISRAMLAVGSRLGITPDEFDMAFNGYMNMADLVWSYISRERQWTLIFDNIDNPDILNHQGSGPLGLGRGWLRSSSAGQVIVTTRLNSTSIWGEATGVLNLGYLPQIEGGRLLLEIAPNGGDLNSAMGLSERLGNLPLAIRQAGSYINSSFTNIQTFDAYYAKLNTNFMKLLGFELQNMEPPRSSVLTTWSVSLQWLKERGSASSVNLLQCLSCCYIGLPIPAEIILGLIVRPPRRIYVTNGLRRTLRIIFFPIAFALEIVSFLLFVLMETLDENSWFSRHCPLDMTFYMFRTSPRLACSIGQLHADLAILESLGLIDLVTGTDEIPVPSVVLHPFVQELLWRDVHEPEVVSRRELPFGFGAIVRYRSSDAITRPIQIAAQISNAAAVAAVVISGMQGTDAKRRWLLLYPHIREIIAYEHHTLSNQQLAEVLTAGHEAAGAIALASIPEGLPNMEVIIMDGPANELSDLLSRIAVARKLGGSGFWQINITMLNYNRYYEVERSEILQALS